MAAVSRWIRPRPRAVIIMLIMLVALLSLGLWQVQRLEWKTQLIAEMTTREATPAVAIGSTADLHAFQKVIFDGRWQQPHFFLIRPRVKDGQSGAHLIVPMTRPQSLQVYFVNLGWVPDKTQRTDVATYLPRGQEVYVLSRPEQGRFTPDNIPTKNQWYWVDIPEMAQTIGVKNFLLLLLNRPEAAPGQSLRNDHRQYAIFWFSMAALLLVVFALAHRRPRGT